MVDFNFLYNKLQDILTDKEMYAIDIHTNICGNNITSLDDCIYAMFGYNSVVQYLYELGVL